MVTKKNEAEHLKEVEAQSELKRIEDNLTDKLKELKEIIKPVPKTKWQIFWERVATGIISITILLLLIWLIKLAIIGIFF